MVSSKCQHVFGKKGRTLFLSPMVPAAASCTRLRARCAFAVMGSWAHAGGWDGKFDSLDNFAVGRVASAEPDSLTRRMLRPLDAGFSGASLFFSELRQDTELVGDALTTAETNQLLNGFYLFAYENFDLAYPMQKF